MDDEVAEAVVLAAAALLVGLAVDDDATTLELLAALLVVAAAELVVGAAEELVAALVAGAADDVAAALEAVALAVPAAVPQAASSEAPARPAAPVRATRMTCRRRNGAPVNGYKSDIMAVSSLMTTLQTTQRESRRFPSRNNRAPRHMPDSRRRGANVLLSSVYENTRRRVDLREHTGTHNLCAR